MPCYGRPHSAAARWVFAGPVFGYLTCLPAFPLLGLGLVFRAVWDNISLP
jgi:hypothetical protein